MSDLNLNVNFDDLSAEDVERFTQAGSRGLPEYAASCNTITINSEDKTINGSCGGGDGLTDEILSDF